MYSSSSGGNIDNGPSLNDLFSINAQGNVVLSSELIAPTVTVVTINAEQENIINVDDLQVTGPVTATGDIVANSGLPNEVSLTALAVSVAAIDPSKTQNIVSANAGQTIWKQQINMRDTLGNTKITIDPDGVSNSGFAAASVGVGSGGCVFTDFVVSSTSNATTANLTTINSTTVNVEDVVIGGSLHPDGTLIVKNNSNVSVAQISPLGVSAPTLNASFNRVITNSFKSATATPIVFEDTSGNTIMSVDQTGNIVAGGSGRFDEIIMNPSDAQISGAGALNMVSGSFSTSLTTLGDFHVGIGDKALIEAATGDINTIGEINVNSGNHILYGNGTATLGNGSIDVYPGTNVDINVPTLVQSTLQVNSNLTVGTSSEFFVDATTGDVTALGTVAASSFTGIQPADLPSNINALKIADGSVTNTEFQYLGGVTSDIQTQINSANTSITTLQGKTQNLSANLISSTFANDLIVQGNLQVQGTNTTNNSVVNVYDGYMSIVQNPADGTTPSLSITQTGTASGSIMRVTDGDSNIKFEINQDCDLNINSGAFTVDSATGDIGTLGGVTAAGNVTIGAGATQIQLKHNTGVIDCVDVHTTTYPTGVNAALTSLQSQVNAKIPITNNKTYYVSLSGSDSNDGLSVGTAVLTLSRACTLAGGSGNAIVVFPGTYTETTSFTNQNLTIAASNFESGGIVNFTGVITVNNPASSVRILGLSFATLIHSGAGSLYLQNCSVNTTLSSSGTGYISMTGCNTQGSSFSGTVSITGAGAKSVNINSGNLVGFLTINNAVASVVVNNALSMAPITLTNGTLSILGNVSVYSAGPTLNAITSSAGTTVALDDVTLLTPGNTPARMSIGGFLSMRKVFFDKVNSSLGTRIAQALVTDTIDVNSLTSSISNTGNTSVSQITSSGNINTASLAINAGAPTSGSVVDLGNSNSSIIVPKGTTGQQPTAVEGMIRYNTTSNQFEGASGSTPSWAPLGGGSGPTFTDTSDTYNIPGNFDGSASLTDVNTLVSGRTIRPLCMNNTYAVFAVTGTGQSSQNITLWVYGISSGTLTFQQSYILNNLNIVGSNIQSFVGACSGNYVFIGITAGTGAGRIIQLTYTPGVGLGSEQLITNRNSGGIMYIMGIDYKQVYTTGGVTYAVLTWIDLDSNSGVSSFFAFWHNTTTNSLVQMSNPSFSPALGISVNYSNVRIAGSYAQPLYEIILSDGNNRMYELAISKSGTSTPSVSQVNVFSFSNNFPSGKYNNVLNPNIIIDDEDTVNNLYFLHICFPVSNGDGTNFGGAFLSYRWSGSSWSGSLDSSQIWQLDDIYTLSNNSYWGGFYYNGGYYNQLTNNLYGFVKNSQLVIGTPAFQGFAQVNLTRSSTAPYLQVSPIGTIKYPLGSATTSVNTFNIICSPDGNNMIGCINNASGAPRQIFIYSRGSAGTVSILWKQTSNNIKETNYLAVADGGIFKLPVTTLASVQALVPAIQNGFTFIDSTSGTIKVYYNGTFKTITWT